MFYNGPGFKKRIARNVLMFLASLFPIVAVAQEKTDSLPDGTEGVVFKVHPEDTILANKKSNLQPNEFEGTHSTFRIGMGFIGDFTTYSYDNTFGRQLDSLKVSLDPTYKTRDFRILG